MSDYPYTSVPEGALRRHASQEQQALLAEVAELTRVDGTVRTRSDFEAELIEIRRRGYSFAKGERVPGMVSVAAPVQPPEGPATAAIQVAGTDAEIPDERIGTLGNEVQRAAYAIARRNCTQPATLVCPGFRQLITWSGNSAEASRRTAPDRGRSPATICGSMQSTRRQGQATQRRPGLWTPPIPAQPLVQQKSSASTTSRCAGSSTVQ